MSPQKTDPDLPGSVQECPGFSGGGVGWQWPDAGLGALSVAMCARDLWKEVTIIFIAFTIVWPQVNNREGTQPPPPPINRKLD